MNPSKHLAVLAGALVVSMAYGASPPAAYGGESPLSEEVIAWSVGDVEEEEDGPGANDIWLMQGDGTGKVQLSSDDSTESWPRIRWSFDGSFLAWRGAHTGPNECCDAQDENAMWVGARSGSGIVTTAQPGTAFIVPSPNGQRFANHQGGDIRVTSFQGGGGANISNDNTDDGFASWSPDGNRLTYKSSPFSDDGCCVGNETPAHIAVRNADGTGFVLITNDEEFDDRFPQWSPTSNQIVFGRSPNDPEDNGNYELDDIWIINADGTGATNLTNAEDGESYNFPRWSPDGSLIAYNFLSAANEGDEDTEQEVWVMNPDGSGKRRLDTEALQGSAGFWGFSWSPDSRQIVYKIDDDDDEELQGLAVVDVASGNLVVQTPAGVGARMPDWSSNSNWIVYEAELEQDGPTEIFVIAAQSGAEAVRLTGTELADDVFDDVSDAKPRFAPVSTAAPPPPPPPPAIPTEAPPNFTG